MNWLIMMWLSLVSTSYSEQSNKQRWSSVPAPAADYLISECHPVISERRLPEFFFFPARFQLVEALLGHQSHQRSWFHFIFGMGGGRIHTLDQSIGIESHRHTKGHSWNAARLLAHFISKIEAKDINLNEEVFRCEKIADIKGQVVNSERGKKASTGHERALKFE